MFMAFSIEKKYRNNPGGVDSARSVSKRMQHTAKRCSVKGQKDFVWESGMITRTVVSV